MNHWTLRLLAGKVVELGLAPSMSHEERCASGSKKRPQAVAEEGVVHSQGERRLRMAHMEDVLDLYAEPYDQPTSGGLL